jgi:hypothetical protein
MDGFTKWTRDDLEYHIVQLIVELYDSQRKYMDGETYSFADILDGLDVGKPLLKDLAREIWRRENYSTAEEWREEKRLLGL